MNLVTKRLGLVLAGVVGVGAIASLAIGASFALFTASGPAQSQTFAAGTVFFSSGTGQGANSTLVTENLGGLAPGDIYCGNGGLGNAGTPGLDCTDIAGLIQGWPGNGPNNFGQGGYYQVNYGGSLPGFVGLSVKITSTSACNANGTAPVGASANIAALCATNLGLPFSQMIGTEPIWNGTSANDHIGSTVLMASNTAGPNSFTELNPSAHNAAVCTDYNSGAQQNTCTWSTGATPDMFAYVGGGTYVSPWTSGDSEPLYLIVAIPPNEQPGTTTNNPAPFTNQTQGSGISLTLNATAVQAAHNLTCTSTTTPYPVTATGVSSCPAGTTASVTSWS